MTPTQLRNSILQTAITGALVPQNPDEGSADTLISQIEDEKRRLIAERNAKKIADARAAGKSDAEIKKLKLEKYTAPKPVNPEDAPFEIPQSWRWVRLGDIFSMQAGKTIIASELTNQNKSGLYPCYGGNGLRGYIAKYNCEGEYALVGRQGALCGNINYSNGKFWATEHCVVVSPFCNNMTAKFIGLFLEQLNLNQYATSTAQPGLSVQKVLTTFFPLPPLPEQRRIVSKLEEILPLVEEYGEAQTELEALNAALPDKLKKSLLQQAITGNLVPQDPADGSAEQLLNNIIREKQRQIKAGIIKLSKPEMKVAKTKIEEEFDIPNTWKWCLLADVCRVFGRIGFRGYTKTDLVYSMEQGAISISPTNMVDSKMSYEKCTYISEEKYLESPEIMLKNGDVLIVKTGSSFGKTVFVSDLPWKATINPQLAIIKDIQIDTKYLVYVLQSPYAQRKYLDFVTGSAIPTFSQEALLGMSIPLPPLPEQRRIVAKLEEMFAEIEKLR